MIERSTIIDSYLSGDARDTEKLVRELLDSGIPARDVMEQGMIAAIEELGTMFGNGEIFLPELLIAGDAMKAALNILKPILAGTKSGMRYVGKVAIGSVQGDIHDIGKNIMLMMLEGNGWEVTDLGVDVSPEDFCEAVRNNDFQVLGLSALLTSTMENQKKTIEALKNAGLRDKVKVAIGGCICTKQWAEEIGADCYATDASEGAQKLLQLLA